MAVRPELVDFGQVKEDESNLIGIAGRHPVRESSEAFGNEILEYTMGLCLDKKRKFHYSRNMVKALNKRSMQIYADRENAQTQEKRRLKGIFRWRTAEGSLGAGKLKAEMKNADAAV